MNLKKLQEEIADAKDRRMNYNDEDSPMYDESLAASENHFIKGLERALEIIKEEEELKSKVNSGLATDEEANTELEFSHQDEMKREENL